MNNPLWQISLRLPSFLTVNESAIEKHQQTFNQFDAVDYVVLGLFLAASLAVGLVASCFGRKGKDAAGGDEKEEFVMGGRQLHMIPVALSLLVSFNSAILILGGPAEIYFNGTMYVLSIFAENIGVILAALIFVPVFYKLRLTSSFEFLELRFKSRVVRLMGNFLLLLNNVIYMGIALYAPATALQYVSKGAIPVEASIAASGVICTFYTAWGGIKAVIWTDVFQSIVMTAGILAIILKGLIDLGGIGNIWQISYKYGRIEFDNFDFDPRVRHTFWGLIIGNGIAYSSTFGVFQASVQRYCSVKTLKQAQWSVILASLGAGVFVVSSCLAGLVIFAHYANVACDPSAAGWIEDSNQIVPYYVMDNLNVPVVPGLFIASLFAGALSSVSSSLSALAATTWEDFFKPYCCISASELKATWINRLFIVFYGVAAVVMGVLSTRFGGTVLQASLAFTGSFGAPLLGLFSMGVLFPFVNKYGAMAGSVCGLIISGWLSIGSYLNGKQLVGLPTNTSNCDFGTPDPTATTLGIVTTGISQTTAATALNPLDDWYSISYVWYPVIGASATTAGGFIVSLFTRGYREEVDEAYINPYAVRFYKFIGRCCGMQLWRESRKNVVHPISDTEAVEIQQMPGQTEPEEDGDSEKLENTDQSGRADEISDAEQSKPADPSGRAEEISDAEQPKPADPSGRAEEISDAEQPKPADQSGRAEEISDAEQPKPSDQSGRADEISDAEQPKPADQSGRADELVDNEGPKSAEQ